MKRSPIARRTPLKRSTKPLKKSPLRRRSKKMQTLYTDERIPFVIATIAERPDCELKSADCTGLSQTVHEGLKRSAGGAIVPGELADEQRQEFWSCCNLCNMYVETHPTWAREHGFTISRFDRNKRVRDENSDSISHLGKLS